MASEEYEGAIMRLGGPGELFGWLVIPPKYSLWADYFAELNSEYGLSNSFCDEIDRQELRSNGKEAPVAVFPDFSSLKYMRDKREEGNKAVVGRFLREYFDPSLFSRCLAHVHKEGASEFIGSGASPMDIELIGEAFDFMRDTLDQANREARHRRFPVFLSAAVGDILRLLPYPEIMRAVDSIELFITCISHFVLGGGIQPEDIRDIGAACDPQAILTIALDSRYRELVIAAGDAGVEFCDVVSLADALAPLDEAWRRGVPVADLFV